MAAPRSVTIKEDKFGRPILGSAVQTAGEPLSSVRQAGELPAVPAMGAAGPTTGQQDTLRALIERIQKPTEFDVTTDPSFLARQAQAQAGAEQATRRAEEELNRRGILESTITSDRLAQIQQTAESKAQEAIPEIIAQRQRQEQQDIQNIINLLGIQTGFETQEFERARATEQREFERATAAEQQTFTREQTRLNRERTDRLDSAKTATDERLVRIKEGLREVDFNNGIVSKRASVLLGIPEGRMSGDERRRQEDDSAKLQAASTKFGRDLQILSAQQTNAKALETQRQTGAIALAEKKAELTPDRQEALSGIAAIITALKEADVSDTIINKIIKERTGQEVFPEIEETRGIREISPTGILPGLIEGGFAPPETGVVPASTKKVEKTAVDKATEDLKRRAGILK